MQPINVTHTNNINHNNFNNNNLNIFCLNIRSLRHKLEAINEFIDSRDKIYTCNSIK